MKFFLPVLDISLRMNYSLGSSKVLARQEPTSGIRLCLNAPVCATGVGQRLFKIHWRCWVQSPLLIWARLVQPGTSSTADLATSRIEWITACRLQHAPSRWDLGLYLLSCTRLGKGGFKFSFWPTDRVRLSAVGETWFKVIRNAIKHLAELSFSCQVTWKIHIKLLNKRAGELIEYHNSTHDLAKDLWKNTRPGSTPGQTYSKPC